MQYHVDPADWKGGKEHQDDILSAAYSSPSMLATGRTKICQIYCLLLSLFVGLNALVHLVSATLLFPSNHTLPYVKSIK